MIDRTSNKIQESAMKAKEYQVGGDHYQSQGVQPIDFILANELDFCEGNVIKYITRWKYRGGLTDLEKAKHYLEFLIEDVKGKEG